MKRKFEYIRAEGLQPGHVFTLRVKTFKAEVLPLQPSEDEWFTGVVISKVDVSASRRGKQFTSDYTDSTQPMLKINAIKMNDVIDIDAGYSTATLNVHTVLISPAQWLQVR